MPNLKPGIATASNGNNIGTLVGAAIRPINPFDQIASAYSFEINGGLHSYETILQRDQIIQERRDWGMLVNVYNNISDTTKNGTYQLKYGLNSTTITDNVNWVIFSGGGGAGSGGGSAYWIDPVKSILNSEPVGPVDGDRYILGDSPAGTNWGGISSTTVVQWNSTLSGGIWETTFPMDSMTVRVNDQNNSIYIYEGIPNYRWIKEKQNQVIPLTATSSNGTSYFGTVDRLFSYESDTIFVVQFATANSGSTFTLNLNGMGTKTVKQQINSGISDFVAKEINTSVVYNLQYDGTYFRLTKPTSSPTLVRYRIQSSETVVVPAYQEYLVYGNLQVDGSLYVDTDGKVVIINGALQVSAGATVSNSGNVQLLTVPLGLGSGFVSKYSEVVTLGAGSGYQIIHNLNSVSVSVTCWDSDNLVVFYPAIDLGSSNDITITSTYSISSARIVVMG
jgi:hypothetical protein